MHYADVWVYPGCASTLKAIYLRQLFLIIRDHRLEYCAGAA
jgi:hypothetical protein